MNLLLNIKNIGKSYRAYKSESRRFASWFGLSVNPSEEHWVLRHIGFEVYSGEAVGIIGQNGAGKSTLLKMIAGTLQSTEGSVQINGRIAAILELGMGFNAELTGRQNAIHSLGVMGFNSDEIHQIIPKIEEFSEIGEYFNEPVRTYSSGMQMRVAFAVATAYRPEILIVDEALSVGDTYFQHKSFSRIREFQEQGTTLLIVSHDRNAIQSLCSRAILLENGAVIKDGNPEEVFDFYNAIIAEKENSTVEVKKLDNSKVQTSSGTGEAKVEKIALYNIKNEAVETVGVGELVELRVKVKVHQSVETLVLGYSIKDRLGQVMYGTNTWHTKQVINQPKSGNEYLFKIAFPVNLGVGSYSIQTALVDRDTHLTANYEWVDLALVFNVININKTHFAGCLWNEPNISIKEVSV
jgi:lipopolysaccharide transport system ATP-binding protein